MLFVIMRRLVSDNVKAEDVWLERLWVHLASVKSRCQPVNHTNSNDVLLLQIQCSSCTHMHTHTFHFNGHFPGEPGLASFIGAEGDEIMGTTAAIRCGKLWSNRHQLQTNTQLFTGRMPFLSPNKQCHKHWREKYHISWTCPPLAHLRVFQLSLWQLKAPGYLGEGCHASCQHSDASTPTHTHTHSRCLFNRAVSPQTS